MASILFVWELGGGSGHVFQIFPFAEHLARRGHQVTVALRGLSGSLMFGRAGIRFVPAPYIFYEYHPVKHLIGFAHLLANVGWGTDRHLAGLTSAWRGLFDLIRPDLIVFDHSPTALLASRGLPARRMVLGLGFFSPPDISPLPVFVEQPGTALIERLRADERQILDRANNLLISWGGPPLQQLGKVYSEVDENILVTFREMDHFAQWRSGARHWGPANLNGSTCGKPVEWPDSASGRSRIYAYLDSDFPCLSVLLDVLRGRRYPTVVFSRSLGYEMRQRFTCDTLRFESQPLDLAQVGRECDLAILNANHGTLSQLLLAGRPMLQVPRTREQGILARAVERTGASLTVSAYESTSDQVSDALDALVSDDGYRRAACCFAEKYAGFDPQQQRQEILERIEQLVSPSFEKVGPMCSV